MSDRIKLTAFKLFNLLSHPSHIRLIFNDLKILSYSMRDNDEHLDAAMQWLCKAQDVTGTGGVAAGYKAQDRGWLPSYPETTGYIIPTFLEYGHIKNDPVFLYRALRMGDWEIEIQLADGAVRGGIGINTYPIVFNTGQVIIGWIALYQETGESRFLNAAVKAADWLADVQDDDGKWSRYTLNNVPHAYHTRVVWPILEVYAQTKNERYKLCAEKYLKWVLSQSKENGWFAYMGFRKEDTPFTHTIAYTIRGLLECAPYFEKNFQKEIMSVVRIASENIINCYERRKRSFDQYPPPLYGTLNEKWESKDRYSCVTGNAQLAIIWLKLYKLYRNPYYLNAGVKILEQVKAMQCFLQNPEIRGAIPGSYPCWGKYEPFSFPNWATKFFADALILKKSILIEHEDML